MSEYPEAQRVRRADLASFPSPGGSSPIQGLDACYQLQLAEIYGQVVSEALDEEQLPGQRDAEPAIDGAEDDTADTYSFRLFSNPSVTGTKIVVRSPTPADRESGFVQPRRRDSYYFTGMLGKELEKQYRHAAISGERIFVLSNISWPGCELPWRVFSIKTTDARQALESANTIETNCQKKRRRVGKKRRIAIRKAITAAKEIQSRAQKVEAEKEAAEKEKRTRRNREKKVKRKLKEKLKKLQIFEESN